MCSFPDDFAPGQKVWFLGRKARVLSADQGETFRASIKKNHWDFWAVPISLNDSGTITIAHADDLRPRGKRK